MRMLPLKSTGQRFWTPPQCMQITLLSSGRRASHCQSKQTPLLVQAKTNQYEHKFGESTRGNPKILTKYGITALLF